MELLGHTAENVNRDVIAGVFLNNILAIILGFTQLTQRQVPPESPVTTCANCRSRDNAPKRWCSKF
jgi:hypothetical protein